MGRIITDPKEMQYALEHIEESKALMMGNVHLEHLRDGKVIYSGDQGKNTFTTEGMTAAVDILFRAQSVWSKVYCGIFKNNATPALGDTASAKLGSGQTYGECQDADYDSPATNRNEYTVAAAAASAVTNTASKAEFVMAGSITVYGAFLTTVAAKTATTGVLICAKKFTTARAVIADDQLAVTYAITMSTS